MTQYICQIRCTSIRTSICHTSVTSANLWKRLFARRMPHSTDQLYREQFHMISLRNENDLLIGMTYDILIGMIDMTFICSVSIFCMEIETEPGGEQKAPVRTAFRNP